MGVHRAHAEREGGRHGDGDADLDHQRRRGAEVGVAVLEGVRTGTELLDGRQHGVVSPEGQQLGRAGQRVDHLRRERPGQGGHLVVAAAAPGQQGGHGQGDGQRHTEGEGGPGEDEPDGDGADHRGAPGDGHRQQGAQVQVLQRVDVVDGARQQVAAAPSRQGGGHPGGQAVVEPDAPAGERAQRGIVADQALGVAQRSAQERQHLDRGQDADERGQAGSQRGASDDVARPRQQADGRRGRSQAQQAGQGEPPEGRARLRQDAPEGSRACLTARPPAGGRPPPATSPRGRSGGAAAARGRPPRRCGRRARAR